MSPEGATKQTNKKVMKPEVIRRVLDMRCS